MVEGGLLAGEAEAANVRFLTAMRRKRPYVALKAAVTLDGYIARPDGESKWITGEEARKRARLLRAEMGAVLVGSGTVAKDDPHLTVRSRRVPNEPLRLVLDSSGVVRGDEKLFSEPGETVVYTPGPSRPYDRLCPLRDGRFDLGFLLADLFERGVTGVLVEGGAVTLRSFVEARLFDRLDLFVGPRIFGAGIPWVCPEGLLEFKPNLTLVGSKKLGRDLWLSYSVG
jgi:diaminohydroxyphosphoribosylaminopyrimidine deaminase/5-amino-6-(5-phosphoribosylamino)uracil reductase